MTEWAEMGDLKRLIRTAIHVKKKIILYNLNIKRKDENLKN